MAWVPDGRRGGRARVAAIDGARAARPAGWAERVRAAGAWVLARLAEEADAGRPALWLPVAFGAGIVLYFAAVHEPELWAALLACAVTFALAAALRRRFLTLWLALALGAGASGFLAAKLATLRADAPVLAHPMRAEVSGRVERIEPRAKGARRVTLAVERFGALGPAERPKTVRVTLGPKPALSAGDRVSLSAFWRPPQGPVRPGGYDFARVAYYEGLGASGAQPTELRALGAAPNLGAAARLSASLERLREALTTRIAGAIGGAEGAVAAALVTGVRGPIPQDVDDTLRAAGLSHILSISGLHMALVAGTLFWLVRAALALSQTVALRWPVKAVAAIAALAGATFYLALSGAEVATQRSYLMIAIVFAAVVAGRPAVTPRNLALAALAVLALTPEAVMGPSFQMSFAAVMGLVAWFETRKDAVAAPPPTSAAGRAAHWLCSAAAVAVMTTLIAGLATAPFAAYHFHRMTPYALAGNLLATPLISLIVMPCVIGGLLFAPLGLDGPWWGLMGFGLEGVLGVAKAVAAWPGSERTLAAFGAGTLALFAFGLVWLCLWRTALRFAALPVLAAAAAAAVSPNRPDVAIDPAGRSIAVRSPDGALQIVGSRFASFASKVWLAADGAAPAPKTSAATSDVRCDPYGCAAPLVGGGVVALIWDARAFEEDCRRAVLVVTRLDAPPACADHTAVVDRTVLAATGALSLTRDGASFAAVAARAPSGGRPWTGPASGAPPDDALRLTFAPRQRPGPAPDSSSLDPTDPEDQLPDEDQ